MNIRFASTHFCIALSTDVSRATELAGIIARTHQRGAMLFCGRELAQESLHRQAANKGAALHLATTMFPHEVKQLPCPYRSQCWDVLIAPRHTLCFVNLCDRKSTSPPPLPPPPPPTTPTPLPSKYHKPENENEQLIMSIMKPFSKKK